MRVKRKTPDPRGNRGGRENVRLSGEPEENTVNHYNLQAYRAAFLARRHRIAPAFAAAVAPLLFQEART